MTKCALNPMATVIVILLLAAMPVQARPVLLWCQACPVELKMDRALRQPVGSLVYVADPIKQTVLAYLIATENEPASGDGKAGPRHVKFARPVPADEAHAEAAMALMKFFSARPDGWHKRVDLSVPENPEGGLDGIRSAYDIAIPGPAQVRVANWLNSSVSSPAIVAWRAATGALRKFRMDPEWSGPRLYASLHFADGSQIGAVSDNERAHLVIDAKSGRDSQSNNIPYMTDDGHIRGLGGIHVFAKNADQADDRKNFLQFLQRSRIAVVSGQTSIHRHPLGWACTETEGQARATYVCQKR